MIGGRGSGRGWSTATHHHMELRVGRSLHATAITTVPHPMLLPHASTPLPLRVQLTLPPQPLPASGCYHPHSCLATTTPPQLPTSPSHYHPPLPPTSSRHHLCSASSSLSHSASSRIPAATHAAMPLLQLPPPTSGHRHPCSVSSLCYPSHHHPCPAAPPPLHIQLPLPTPSCHSCLVAATPTLCAAAATPLPPPTAPHCRHSVSSCKPHTRTMSIPMPPTPLPPHTPHPPGLL